MHEKQIGRLENEIKQLKEKRRQFLLDYHLYQLNNNGFIENEENLVSHIVNAPTSDGIAVKRSKGKK